MCKSCFENEVTFTDRAVDFFSGICVFRDKITKRDICDGLPSHGFPLGQEKVFCALELRGGTENWAASHELWDILIGISLIAA
jgi:hypothetical protein